VQRSNRIRTIFASHCASDVSSFYLSLSPSVFSSFAPTDRHPLNRPPPPLIANPIPQSLDAAVEHYTRALAIHPAFVVCLSNRAAAHLAARRFAASARDCTLALVHIDGTAPTPAAATAAGGGADKVPTVCGGSDEKQSSATTMHCECLKNHYATAFSGLTVCQQFMFFNNNKKSRII
jgi:hypothetical protein